jgi:hypothetical protein
LTAQKKIQDMITKDEYVDNIERLLFTNDLISEISDKLRRIEAGEEVQEPPPSDVVQTGDDALIDLTDFNMDAPAAPAVPVDELAGLTFAPPPFSLKTRDDMEGLSFHSAPPPTTLHSLIDLLDATPTSSPTVQRTPPSLT